MRTIGRYRVGASLGRGGMAEVFEAWDPQLRRAVALKVVTSEGRRRKSRRIMREAQAQAQLSHPNVVGVYDVGIENDDVYIAMELVRGPTLRDWLELGRRSTSEVLDKFLRAAEGLIAAHDVGLVHRDFKPSNVLIGEDGVPKVADFGLAVQSQDTDGSSSGEAAAIAELDRRLTQTGFTFGTPLYMAPEQHRGQRLDAAADQFAFCASLFEALTGEVPFRSTTMEKLAEEKSSGAPRVPAGIDLPRRVVAALRRGLHPERTRRWPSMRALVDALQEKRRRRWWMVPAFAMVGGLGWISLASGERCDGRARLEEAWGQSAQEQLRAAIVVEGVPHAEAAWHHLYGTLDAYATAWAGAYDEACEAAERDGPDPRRECLQARLRRFTAVAQAFARAGPDALESIDTALTDLASPTECLDPDAAVAVAQPDAEWIAIDGLLAEASAEVMATQFDRARELGLEALGRAERSGDRRLEAHALFEVGLAEAELERFAEAVPHLERAYFLADELAEHRLAALAAAKRAWAVAESGAVEADPERWIGHALSHMRLTDDGRTRAAVQLSLTAMHQREGAYERAAEYASEAAKEFAAAYGEPHPSVASALNNQGLALVMAGKVDAALPVLERSAAMYEETLGEMAPRRTHPLLNIGLGQYELQRWSEAAATFDQVLALARAQTKPQPGIIGRALSNKGLCLLELGDMSGALAAFMEAREQIVGALGPSHPLALTIEMNIALTHHHAEDYEAAVAAYERARTGQVEVLGVDHPETARTEHNLGVTLNALGRYEDAAAHLRAAKATFEKRLGPRSELAALSTVELSRSLAELGQLEEALRLADLSRELLTETSGPESRWITFSLLYRQVALRKLGRIEEARAALEQARRLVDALPDPEPLLRRDLEIEREKLASAKGAR